MAQNMSMTIVADTPSPRWFIYLVRTGAGSLYAGISTDPERRLRQHQSGKGARFFHTSPAQALAYVEACAGKGDALRRERAIKRLSKAAKEALIRSVDGASSAVGSVRD